MKKGLDLDENEQIKRLNESVLNRIRNKSGAGAAGSRPAGSPSEQFPIAGGILRQLDGGQTGQQRNVEQAGGSSDSILPSGRRQRIVDIFRAATHHTSGLMLERSYSRL